jgi:hypothetical protein
MKRPCQHIHVLVSVIPIAREECKALLALKSRLRSIFLQKLPGPLVYSALRLFTGLEIAALTAWKLTVTSAMATTIKAASANIIQLSAMR